MKLEYDIYGARLRAPLVSAHSRTDVRSLVRVRLVAEDGFVGVGEAAPLESYDGVSVQDVVAALDAWRPGGPLPLLPQAAAAIEMALWDLEGRRAGEPVWRLLGAQRAVPIAVNATIGAEDPCDAARAAQSARAAGFRCVKLKVGAGEDLARVRAVREAAGAELAIRLDANGAWSVREAIAALAALAPVGIECCEEPVHGAAALADVASGSPVPVSADESAREALAGGERVCAAVCLKIAASGGISGVLRDAKLARELGYEVYLASTLDGPPGIAAALHAAAVIVPDRPCGLATLAMFEAEDPLPPAGGFMAAPSTPGLIG